MIILKFLIELSFKVKQLRLPKVNILVKIIYYLIELIKITKKM